MTTHITKTWFDGEKVVTQEIPESEVYKQEPDAYGYARRLAEAIWQKHYKAVAPQWKPLDDLMGVLTQIDNMTSGLIARQDKQEPVAWVRWDDEENYYDVRRTPPTQENIDYLAKWNRPAWVPAYPHPPQRQPLTEEEIAVIAAASGGLASDFVITVARAIERAHGIGGGK
jgi:hypothetical protein